MRVWIGAAAVIGAGLLAQDASAADKAWTMTSMTAVPVGADLRLRVLSVQSADPAVNIDNEASRLRKGFGGSMIDYFPFGIDGFHLSGGGRMTNRGPSVFHDNLLLYAPRQGGYRSSSRHLTPALTMGYSKQVEHGLTMGIEGGMVMGHLDSSYYSVVHPSRFGRVSNEGIGSGNAVARLTAAFRF